MNLKTSSELYGYGTSEGVTKSWDTRGRTYHPEYPKPGVHLGIFDRPERPNQYAHRAGKFFAFEAPTKPERERISRNFNQAIKIGKREVVLNELIPMQKTILQRRVDRVQKTEKADPTFFSTKKVPAVFRFEGKQYIMDGHHRLAYDRMTNKGTSMAIVYTMPRTYRA
jgi:hypothetical protein